MLTIYKQNDHVKRVKGEFTAFEWLLILKALDRFIHDQKSHEDDVKLAKKIWSMEQKFVEEREPFINKPCVSEGVCHEDKMKVLEKIRAKIERYKSTVDNAISDDELKIEGMKEAYTDCLEIIDKYMKEGDEE